MGKEVAFRADADFAWPEYCDTLEKRRVKWAFWIPANDSLERDIAELLPRPVTCNSVDVRTYCFFWHNDRMRERNTSVSEPAWSAA
jgi:hypothetical protein